MCQNCHAPRNLPILQIVTDTGIHYLLLCAPCTSKFRAAHVPCQTMRYIGADGTLYSVEGASRVHQNS